MVKFQYFGPPFNVQLSDRTLQLRSGSVVQLDESEADIVRSYDGVRLVSVPEPKMVVRSLSESEKVIEELMTTDTEGVIIDHDDLDNIFEQPLDDHEKESGKKKKKKKERKKNAPSANNEG